MSTFDINSILKGFDKSCRIMLTPKPNWRVYQKELRMALLHELELWKIISTGADAASLPTGTAELSAWRKRDQTDAMSVIWRTIGETSLCHKDLKDVETGSLAYETLRQRFDKDVRSHRFQARHRFNHPMHDISCPVEDFISSITEAADDLAAINCGPGITEIVDMIIMNLDKSFSEIQTSLMQNSIHQRKFTVVEVRAALIEWEESKKAPKSTDVAVADDSAGTKTELASALRALKAFEARFKSSGRHLSSRSDDSGPEDNPAFSWLNPRSEGCCDRCGKKGHHARSCVYNMPVKVKDKVLRKEKAHLANDGKFSSGERAGKAYGRIPDSDDETVESGDDSDHSSTSSDAGPSSCPFSSRSHKVYLSKAMLDHIQWELIFIFILYLRAPYIVGVSGGMLRGSNSDK
ncbi:hypothetical protein C8J56DRAFT_1131177 [Mycena floridula]|nr:hypothetical protein C8J56DRAFT_1131177 [Mycena floridula]